MSSSDADAIASYESILVNNYCVFAASNREVNLFWFGAPTGASILFLSNRYLSLAINVLGMTEFGHMSDETRFSFDLTGVNDPKWGCFAEDSTPLSLQTRFIIVSRGALILSDALVIGLTWWALPRYTMSFATLRKTGATLTTVILRDGTLYFGVLLIMNVLHLAFTLTTIFGFEDNGASNVTAFTEVVTAVLVSRFLLNLQEASKASARGMDSTHQLSTIAEARTINFARFMGSMGESIGPGLPGSDSSGSTTEDTDGTDKPDHILWHPSALNVELGVPIEMRSWKRSMLVARHDIWILSTATQLCPIAFSEAGRHGWVVSPVSLCILLSVSLGLTEPAGRMLPAVYRIRGSFEVGFCAMGYYLLQVGGRNAAGNSSLGLGESRRHVEGCKRGRPRFQSSMSSSDADAIASYESIVVNNYCVVAASVFLLYEYVITIDREVNAFWYRAPTGASILFLSNRYLSFVVNVLGLIEFGHLSDESCASIARGLSVLTFMNYLPWAAFSGLRAYALCRGVMLSTLVFLLALVPLPINAARFSFDLTGVNDPQWGCFAEDSTPSSLQLKFVIISRTCLIVSDALLMGLTWWALPKHTISFATIRKTGVSLTTVLLRDGTLYFGVLLIMNVLHLAFSLTSMFGFTDNGASNVTAFTEVVTAVLVSRFLLNLQEANKVAIKGMCSMDQLSTIPETQTISFARFIGSMGESFGPGLPGSDASSSTEDTDDTLKVESFEVRP
ncbi:hypothetical protein C8T65DRAFT_696536 [Cerioporus squamosus]|nr:hypothetical protein C8T65DRAFT_696536 [Cerioporus squamosus]